MFTWSQTLAAAPLAGYPHDFAGQQRSSDWADPVATGAFPGAPRHSPKTYAPGRLVFTFFFYI